MPLLRDQLPSQYAAWVAAAGGEDAVLDRQFRFHALATGMIPSSTDDGKVVGEQLATAFNQYNRVLLSLKQ